jgi:hypothetical protein
MAVPTLENMRLQVLTVRNAENSPYRLEISRTRSTISLMAEAAMLFKFTCGLVELRRRVLLQLDRAGKQDVVLQVNVLVQIGFEGSQSLIERLKAEATVRRSRISVSHFQGTLRAMRNFSAE